MKRTLVFFALLACGGCYSRSSYHGDGVLSDRGHFSSPPRFVLDLGPIDLSQPSEHIYRLKGLPHEMLTGGFEVRTTTSEVLLDKKPVKSRIRFVLENERKEVVCSRDAFLSQWTWSGAGQPGCSSFVYAPGTGSYPLDSDSHSSDSPTPDMGWGSYFTPRTSAQYKLTIAVTEPEAPQQYSAHVVFEGGGLELP